MDALAPIFAAGQEGGGDGGRGARNHRVGLVAVLRLGLNLITYAVQPISVKIALSWSVGGLLEAAVAGAIAGAIYKQAQATAQPGV